MENLLNESTKNFLVQERNACAKFSFYDDADEELVRLRNERKLAEEKYCEIQKKIDNRILELNNLHDLVGKYVILCGDESVKTYVIVDDVKRMSRGAKLIGKTFEISTDEMGVIVNFSMYDDSETFVSNRDDIFIASKDEFISAMKNVINTIESLTL